MRKSMFLIAGAVVALTATPSLAQSASASSNSVTGSTSAAIAPPNGGVSTSFAIGGNASVGNAQASSIIVPGPGLVNTTLTNSSSVGGSATGGSRIGVGGISGGFGFGFGAGSGTASVP